MKRATWVVLLILLVIAAFPADAGKKPKVKDLMLPKGYPEIPAEQMALTDVPYAQGAPAVVLLTAREYDWEGYEFKRDRYFRRVKILTEDAIEEYGSFQSNLWGDWRIKEVKARTVLPDGTVVDAAEGINQEESDDEVQVIQINFPQVQVGAILDLDIQLSSQGWSFDPWTIQEWIPILETRLVMKPPVGLKFRVAPYRLPAEKSQPDASLNIAGGKKAFIWYFRDVEALPDLAYLPPLEDASQRLFVILQQYKDSYNFIPIAADWKSWGERRKEGWDEWFKKSHARTESLAKQLATEKAGPVEKAEAIRQGLRERMRVSHVSRFAYKDTPDEELDSGSASTGGIAALAALMLRKVGVEADLVAFRRRSDGIMILEFPIPRMINDLMVRIPDGKGGQMFISPSSDLHVSRLPFDCSGVAAFPFDGKAEAPLPVPDFTASQNMTRRSFRGSLDADGTLTASGTETFKGVAAERWRNRLRDGTEEERRDRVEKSLQARLPGLLLGSLEIKNLDEAEKDLVLEYDWEIESFASVAGKRLIFNPNLYTKMSTADWAPETREYDIDLRQNWDISDTFMIRLPEGVKNVTGPDNARLQADPVGLHEASYEKRGQMLVAKRHSRIDMYRMPPSYYPGLRRWFTDIATADEKPVVVELE